MNLRNLNVNGLLADAIWQMRVSGVKEETRNGPVLSIPEPVLITYENPCERVLWEPRRDANPFFHLMESLWMLAGRDDSEYVSIFNKRMKEYAEDDGRIHGAYGMRWRHAYGFDQLDALINELRKNPTSRRAVLAMWYAYADLGQNYKDLPCNTHAYFRINDDVLDMTVCNRSNDLLWGAFGANAVHFSILQEFLANALGIPVGRYHQFTNNLHAYLNVEMMASFLETPPACVDLYSTADIRPYPIITTSNYAGFLEELPRLFNRDYMTLNQPFLIDVAMPMQEYYFSRREGKPDEELLHGMVDCDWKWAALDWVSRRANQTAQDALDPAVAALVAARQ